MKVAILAGGKGSRLAEETEVKPKPMVTIGGRPILWHIMQHYAHYGHKEFYIALGYKGEAIKRYIVDHTSLQGDLTVDLSKGSVRQRSTVCREWTGSFTLLRPEKKPRPEVVSNGLRPTLEKKHSCLRGATVSRTSI